MKNVKEQLKQIKKFYNELPDELFKQRLIEAGFEIIENSNGEFVYREYDEEFEKEYDNLPTAKCIQCGREYPILPMYFNQYGECSAGTG